MELTANNKLKNLLVIGDRVLIKPVKESQRTSSGIYLPPGVQEKEKVQIGFVVKAGPGYPIPSTMEEENWKGEDEKIKYLPLQVQEGDKAIFLQKDAFDVIYNEEKYFIVSQSSILMVEREEDIFS